MRRSQATVQLPRSSRFQRQSSTFQAPPLTFKHLPPRTRCLTPSPTGRQLLPCSAMDEQTQSPLFKLPEGVRLMIYEEVIGKELLHIVRRQSQLGHIQCNSRDVDLCRVVFCRGLKLATGTCVQLRPGKSDLSLLKTCRRIYIDAVQVLYSSNTFDFDSMEGFIAMSCVLLPQRFDSIQSLQMDFRFDLCVHFSEETTCFNNFPRWERTWRILASMKDLQSLRIRLSWPKEAIYDSEEKRYLAPLWLLTEMEVFEASLPPLMDKEKPWGAEPPFKIVRRITS